MSGYTGDGGTAMGATLNVPSAVTLDISGNLYIADTGNAVIRMVSPFGAISTYVGKLGATSNAGDGGSAASASLVSPSDIALDAAGDLYIASGGEVRVVNTTGTISTIAGNGQTGGI